MGKIALWVIKRLMALIPPWQHDQVLYFMAETQLASPIDFVLAMHAAPGYDREKASHIAAQYFDTYGFPMEDSLWH